MRGWPAVADRIFRLGSLSGRSFRCGAAPSVSLDHIEPAISANMKTPLRWVLICDFIKAEAAVRVNCVPAGKGLPSTDSDIDEARLDLHRAGMASHPLG